MTVEEQLRPVVDSVRETAREIGRPDLAERLVGPLCASMAALDALPRTDPFWTGRANNRATIHKLYDHARERVARDPSDRLASRTLVALDLHHGANDFGMTHLAVEAAEELSAVGDAVLIAHLVSFRLGLDPTFDLRKTLAGVDRTALAALAHKHTGWTGTAARIALDVLGGTCLDEAYARHT